MATQCDYDCKLVGGAETEVEIRLDERYRKIEQYKIMRYLVILPVVSQEVTDNCIRSISNNVKKNLLVVDNSSNKFTSGYDIKTHIPKTNIGVARAWNIGANIVLGEKLDYLVILSATIVFDKGMEDFTEALEVCHNPYGMDTMHGWHLIAIGRKTFETIGLFDENFYPAYYEDTDFIRRMELAGIHNPMSTVQRLEWANVSARSQGNAHGMKSTKVNMEACRNYFLEKWGADSHYNSQADRDKLYTHPFNVPHNDLAYFPKRDIDELKTKYGL